MYYIYGMRTVIKTTEFRAFYESLPKNVRDKIDYAISIIENFSVFHSKLTKKLVGTDFYELRISTNNEYRVLLFSVDHENIMEATQVYF